MGWIFMTSAGSYMITAPFWGALNQKGFVGYVITSGLFGGALLHLLFSLTDQFPRLQCVSYVTAAFAFEGFVVAALFASGFIIIRKIAENQGTPRFFT